MGLGPGGQLRYPSRRSSTATGYHGGGWRNGSIGDAAGGGGGALSGLWAAAAADGDTSSGGTTTANSSSGSSYAAGNGSSTTTTSSSSSSSSVGGNYPEGVGEFQCHDKFLRASLAAAAARAGRPEWGAAGPADTGGYSFWPHQTGFFRRGGGWDSEYGRFFAGWYSGVLAGHADRVLAAAAAALAGRGVRLGAAVPLCFWWYHTPSRAVGGFGGVIDRVALRF